MSELVPQDTTDVATATEVLRDRARQLADGVPWWCVVSSRAWRLGAHRDGRRA
jgi:hypothetical protein